MQFMFQQFNIIIWKTHDFQRKMIYMASFPTFSHMGVAEVKMAGLPFPVPDLNGAGGPGSGFQLWNMARKKSNVGHGELIYHLVI